MKKSKIVVIVLVVLAVAAAAVAGIRAYFNRRTIVEIKNYVAVTYTGFNHHGTAKLEVDYDSLDAFIDNEKLNQKLISEKLINKGEKREFKFSDLFKLEFDKEKGNLELSNGDTVTVNVAKAENDVFRNRELEDILKYSGLDFLKSFDYKVSGLKTATEIDFFENIESYITFSRANGYGICDYSFEYWGEKQVDKLSLIISADEDAIEIVSNNQLVGNVTYVLTSDEGVENGKLKKGDKLIVNLVCSDATLNALEKLGYIPKNTTYEITVPDLGEYITSVDELSAVELQRIIAALTTRSPLFRDKDYKHGDVYFGTAKTSAILDPDKRIVFSTVYTHTGWLLEYSKCITVSNVVREADGTVTYDVSSPFSVDGTDDLDKLDKNYTYKKVQ